MDEIIEEDVNKIIEEVREAYDFPHIGNTLVKLVENARKLKIYAKTDEEHEYADKYGKRVEHQLSEIKEMCRYILHKRKA